MLVISGRSSNLRNSCTTAVILRETISKRFQHLGFPHRRAGVVPWQSSSSRQRAEQHGEGSEKSQQGPSVWGPPASCSAYVQEFPGWCVCRSRAGLCPAGSAVALGGFPAGRAGLTVTGRALLVGCTWVRQHIAAKSLTSLQAGEQARTLALQTVCSRPDPPPLLEGLREFCSGPCAVTDFVPCLQRISFSQ